MGKKMSWETAQTFGKTEKNESIYNPPNKYGYKININNPKIRPFYEAYKAKIGAVILSDKERHEFENAVFKMIERNNKHD